MLTPIQNSGPASHQPQLQQDEHFVVSCDRLKKKCFFRKKMFVIEKNVMLNKKKVYLAFNVINMLMLQFLKDHFLV
jgi:hypothetical protein